MQQKIKKKFSVFHIILFELVSPLGREYLSLAVNELIKDNLECWMSNGVLKRGFLDI